MAEPDRLWQLRDHKGTLQFTKVPNPIVKELFDSAGVEGRITLFIIRWSIGFHRRWTSFFNNKDIARGVSCRSESVSRSIANGIKKGKFLRGKRRDMSYKYAINLDYYVKQDCPNGQTGLTNMSNTIDENVKPSKTGIDGLVKGVASKKGVSGYVRGNYDKSLKPLYYRTQKRNSIDNYIYNNKDSSKESNGIYPLKNKPSFI